MADQLFGTLGFVTGPRGVFLPSSAYSGFWERSDSKLPGMTLPIGFGVELE